MAIVDTDKLLGEVSFQNFLLFIFVVILSVILGNILRLLIVRFLKDKTKPVFYKAFSRVVMYSIYFIGFYFAFQKILNFNIPAFLAALGILGITFLLTMLPVLQNVFAGIVLSLERPFREGDIVEVDGAICIVKDIMLRKTFLRSLDGKIIIVSNIRFVTGSVINYSQGEFIRVDLDIDIKNDSSYQKAIDIINKILHEEPKIFIRNAGKDKISLQVWFWIWDILRKESIVSNFYETLLQEFRNNKISFG